MKYILILKVLFIVSCCHQDRINKSDEYGTDETKIICESNIQNLSPEDMTILKTFLDQQKGNKSIWRLFYYPKRNEYVASRAMYSLPAFGDIVGEWSFHKKENQWYYANSYGYRENKNLKYIKIITKESTKFVPNR